MKKISWIILLFLSPAVMAEDRLESSIPYSLISSKADSSIPTGSGEERADFVTFWAPLMINYDQVYIHFKVNEECNVFAELEIKPKPDEIGRFYLLWSELPADFDRSKVEPQNLPTMNRNGFTVLEWGGAQIVLSSPEEN